MGMSVSMKLVRNPGTFAEEDPSGLMKRGAAFVAVIFSIDSSLVSRGTSRSFHQRGKGNSVKHTHTHTEDRSQLHVNTHKYHSLAEEDIIQRKTMRVVEA